MFLFDDPMSLSRIMQILGQGQVFMMKNIILLACLSWVGLTYAKHPIEVESMSDSEHFKVEKAVKETEATRSVAGDKIKKPAKVEAPTEDSDSEVRYWQYSE